MPISAVAAPIMTRVNTSMALRPSLSPRWPATMAPSGRNRKLMPIRAKDRICARPGLESFSGVRNSGDSSVAVSWAKMKKSYHSMVVPTRVPARTLRSSCLLLGPDSESTCEVAVIGTPWLGAAMLPGDEVSSDLLIERSVSMKNTMECVARHTKLEYTPAARVGRRKRGRRSSGVQSVAVQEFAEPGPDRFAVVGVDRGAGHPDRIPEEEVLVEGLAARETGDRGVKGQLEQADALGPGQCLPLQVQVDVCPASLLTSASPGSAMSPRRRTSG